MADAEIVRLLRKYSQNRLPKEEVLKRMEKYGPLDLWQAKLRLMMNEDFQEENLTRVNTLISDIKDRESKEILKKLDDSHPIVSFMTDHSDINQKLNELEKMSEELEKNKKIDKRRMIDIIHELKKMNEHDKREEELLFSKLKRKNMNEMVKLLEIRHSRLENRVDKLYELTKDFENNKKRIAKNIKKISYSMRDHFFKENDILYPISLKLIDNWNH